MSNSTLGSAAHNESDVGPTIGFELNTTSMEVDIQSEKTTEQTSTPPPYVRPSWTTSDVFSSEGPSTAGDTNSNLTSSTVGELYNATDTDSSSTADSLYNQNSTFYPSSLSYSNQTVNSAVTNTSFVLNDTSPSLSTRLWTHSLSLTNHTSDAPFEPISLNTTAQTNPVQTSTLGSDLIHYNKSTPDNGVLEILYKVRDFENDSWLYNSSDNFTDYNNTEPLQITLKHPALGVLLCCFVVVVIIGNLLVIAAVARERYLRSVTNYLIVSLAVADLLVGGIVMPFSIVLEMTGGIWLFTHNWCDLWHSFDVLGSTGSILNLCVIALDRYWAITDPIAYPTRMSNKRVWILISVVWVCSAVISFPAILWWRAVSPHTNENECVFSEDIGYLIFSSIVSFYTPLMIMLFVYYKIYKAATARTRSLMTGTKVIAPHGLRGEVMTLRIHRGKATVRNGHDNVSYHRPAYTDTETDSASHMTRSDSDDENRPARFIKRKIQKFAIGRKLSKLAKEQKAAKTLGIVMGVFIICWVPFFVTNVLWAICRTSCVVHADVFFPIFTWLGYLNSGMNPIIYALSMRDFRRAFKRLMCSWCPNYSIHTKARILHMRSMSTSSFTGPSCATERFPTVRL